MREVEIPLKGWKLADALGELRKWLDHNDCVPLSFDIARAPVPVLGPDEMADRFQRDFGG